MIYKLRELIFRWQWLRANRDWKDCRQKKKALERAIRMWRGKE